MQPEGQEGNLVDTQWPRYQVFQQEKAGAPHQDVGSVHAPDPEMALFNARDVFVRRPDCFSLWVVPVQAITFRTAQEYQAQEEKDPPASQDQTETYEVFSKVKSAGTLTWAGSVEAASPEGALHRGVERFSGVGSPFAWCVFPSRAITANEADEIESLFTPAREKHFRLSSDFHTHSAMREMRTAGSKAVGLDIETPGQGEGACEV
jgi:ring-1,2-phenylacetyl-CoA epoxidase subunit PaaB